MNPFIELQKTIAVFFIALVCFGLSPASRALLPPPPPDGGYPNNNTAEGDSALFNLTTGSFNTANGFDALFSNTEGGQNTATGAFALLSNTTGFGNTAIGFEALFFNTIGFNNTATGFAALEHNNGNDNTATGTFALLSNTTGFRNTATGVAALFNNKTGTDNTASGEAALSINTSGSNNTAIGVRALSNATTAHGNTATGAGALLSDNTGQQNTADGQNALFNNTTGSSNIALGFRAGFNLTTGSGNIDIGNGGVAGESGTIRIGSFQTRTFIAGISGVPVTGSQVVVNSNGKLGVVASSARFKDAIKPMDKASEAILALKPVTFHYKKEVDPDGIPQFGLVAEQVEKVNPDLVARDEQGKVCSVRYEAVNAMLLNEFLKAHRRMQEQDAAIARQQKQIEALTAGLQKVSAQLELSKPAPQTVLNNP
jgi:hypothetical protein